MTECLCCKANSDEPANSLGVPIHDGIFWTVEHAYSTSLLGWIVVRLKRHCEELHNLSREEFVELAQIQFATTRSLNELLHLEKEYTACFSETEGFKHLHVHIIPKAVGTKADYVGTNSFKFLKATDEGRLKTAEIHSFALNLKEHFDRVYSE